VQVKLTTTGRRTGKPRTVTLYAWPDGDDYIVVGSRGGARTDPAWAVNLRSEPNAVLRVAKTERAVRAREAKAPQRDRLWTLVTEAFPLYATYQRRTSRTIPLFVLEATDPS
jgi:deazaflavin-dependent oxidoreductase (nitroreductase family)